jgi:spermidine synthase
MHTNPPYRSLFLLSASALGYEILLMRLFSIIQWHHFAYLVIALALLGYGVSGTLLWLLQKKLLPQYSWTYLGAIMLFALSAPGSYLLVQSLAFNIEELLWDPVQIFKLLLIFLLLALPFVFAASAICITFMAFSQNRTGTIYALDLLGAGLGSFGIIGLMYLLLPERILIILGLGGILAGWLATQELALPKRRLLAGMMGLIALALLSVTPQIELNYSPYKGLSQALQVKGAKVLETRSSPLGYLSVITSPEVPLRHAPGLSLIADGLPPEQLGLFTDADNMSAIAAYSGRSQAWDYLDQTTAALPYHLHKPNRLLIIGSGAGSDLRLAHYHGIDFIDALELNPQVIHLVKERFADFAGPLYQRPGTRLHITEARDFLNQTEKRYDLIQLALIDAHGASASGLYALNESYLYTQEAIAQYLSHLAPNGYLAITRWIKLPPRDMLKLFATAWGVLNEMGVPDAQKRLLLIRSWQTGTLLIKNGPFNDKELDEVSRFCKRLFFDLAYTPEITPDMSNRYNQLAKPYFHEATQAIISDKIETFFTNYKFHLQPATDDRPYFHNFFKWSSFLEALKLRDQGGLPLIEWGYVILLVTLAFTLLIGGLLIIAPLFLLKPPLSNRPFQIHPWRVIVYFFAIGLAFLFIEIAFIQRFLRFLHHPIYAITVTLSAFLVFAGLGSQSSRLLSNRMGQPGLLVLVFGSIAFLSLLYLLSLDKLFLLFAHLSLTGKVLISLLLVAPLAFFMGLPFPLALSEIKAHSASLIPWAWGINGYASVISASLATLIAIHFGFTTVILSAVAIYLSAFIVFPRLSRAPG